MLLIFKYGIKLQYDVYKFSLHWFEGLLPSFLYYYETSDLIWSNQFHIDSDIRVDTDTQEYSDWKKTDNLFRHNV